MLDHGRVILGTRFRTDMCLGGVWVLSMYMFTLLLPSFDPSICRLALTLRRSAALSFMPCLPLAEQTVDGVEIDRHF